MNLPRSDKFLLYVFNFLFIVAIFRTFYLASANYGANFKKPLFRGSIMSRDRSILSISVDNYKLFIKKTESLEELPLEEIASIVDMEKEEIVSLLNAKEKGLVLIKEGVGRENISKLQKLDNKNIIVDSVPKRNHPYPTLLSHTLGFINRDNQGVAGLEKYYNDFLLSGNKSEERNLILSVDYELQKHVEKMLDRKINDVEAAGGFVIIEDIKTGFIRSLAFRPNFNLDNFAKENPSHFINQVVSGVAEPGSVMKSFFIAYLLDNKLVGLDDTFETNGQIQLINGEVIRDTAPAGSYNLARIIERSSNAGMISAMDKVSKEAMMDFLKKAYFFQKTGIDLPAETNNLIPPIGDWGIRTAATVPLGHGIALSPISVVATFSALLNNGVFIEPRIVEAKEINIDGRITSIPTEMKKRAPIISEETSKTLVSLLLNGTKAGSTGSKANHGKYVSIGKTGTSVLVDVQKRSYTNKYYTFFLGAYPSDEPQFAIFVGINKPQKEHGGGSVAAPLYGDVIEMAAKRLSEKNDQKVEQIKNEDLTYSRDFKFYAKDAMPSFVGLSLRDALIASQRLKSHLESNDVFIFIRTEGSKGYVKKQSIRAGTQITNGMNLVLEFEESK